MSTSTEIGKGIVAGALISAVVAPTAYGIYKLDKSDRDNNHRQDAALEQAIKPTAVKVAKYVLKQSTEKPFVYDGEYQYQLGEIGDGATTISVNIRKVEGQAPSANDVTMVDVTEWRAPGGEFGDVGPEYGEFLELDGDTWVGVATFDPAAPYDNELNLDHSYSTAKQPYVTFEQNLDAAQSIVESVQDQYKSADIKVK